MVGYNPQKPGRPSHVYHTYFAGNLRMVLDVEVQTGNQASASHAQPGLWRYIDELPVKSRPVFVRGDCAWDNESVTREAEQRKVGYLFKLRQSTNVKRRIYEAFKRADWQDAGQGWEGVEDTLSLCGWTKHRRVVVMRRSIKDQAVVADVPKDTEVQLSLLELSDPVTKYECAVLVTSLSDEILTIAQHYRDRTDIENLFDEMKNQWG